MSRQAGCERLGHFRFPRVSGDEPNEHALHPRHDQFSPRERG